MGYFDVLFKYEWELTKSPAGAMAVDAEGRRSEETWRRMPPIRRRRCRSMMTTADMAMRMDPDLREDLSPLPREPEEFADAFARAWFKLTHRDMGPKARYLGPKCRPKT
jgi:catalase-peroxidase